MNIEREKEITKEVVKEFKEMSPSEVTYKFITYAITIASLMELNHDKIEAVSDKAWEVINLIQKEAVLD